MRILMITYQGDMAGSTNSISYLTKGLAEKGHQVYMGCRKESLLYQMLSGTKVKLIPMTFKGKLDRNNMRQIRDVVLQYNIQLINAQSSFDRYTSIIARWRYNLPVKIVHTRRNYPMSIGGWLQNTFYVKGTDNIIAISEELKNSLIKLGIPASHIHVIYNGVPKERFEVFNPEKVKILRTKWELESSDIIIGFVGREKGQQQLIEALQYLNKNLTIVFIGINEDYIADAVEKFKPVQRIICTGGVTAEEVINWYSMMNVNILASYEGFGLVLIEAMGMGVPVIGTNATGIKNAIEDGKSGLLFEDKNAKDLADKIKLVLEDHALREKLIQNGLKRAHETFSIENTVLAYEQFFTELLNER